MTVARHLGNFRQRQTTFFQQFYSKIHFQFDGIIKNSSPEQLFEPRVFNLV